MASWDSGGSTPDAMTTPRSIEEITRAAQDYEYNAQIPLRYWLRTAAALLKEADIYMREGDDETTYLLLFRHAHLILSNLAVHPSARDPSTMTQLDLAKRDVNKNFRVLDSLKPKIRQRYERSVTLGRDRRAGRTHALQQQDVNKVTLVERKREISPRQRVQQLHGHEHRELAVSLARREFERRAGAQELSEIERQSSPEGRDDLSQRLQAIRPRITAEVVHAGDQFTHEKSRSDYHYPNVRTPASRQSHGLQSQDHQRPQHIPAQALSSPPVPPPKPLRLEQIDAPSKPDKIQHSPSADAAVHDQPAYTFASTASLENGAPLRTLFLPPTLRTTFLRLAHKNTMANLETCAFLAGTLISNALFVSKLIVPAQVATSDTCEMTNESQLFDYVDSEKDLMVLGWIHTHPTQTCFMSSRDLHTHAGYQMMLSESVAIVCAPSKGDTLYGGDWGVYRLTDPPGKMAILNCTKPGIFHPHDVQDVYTDALRPGHVVEAKGLQFEVVDLRDV